MRIDPNAICVADKAQGTSRFSHSFFLGTIDRYEIFSNNNISLSSGTYRCIGGTKHFTSFASQFVKTETNLRLENTFGTACRGLKVYGYKVTKPEAGVYMPATKT